LLDDYGYGKRQDGLSFKVNIPKALAFWRWWGNRKKRKEAELDAKIEEARKNDAEWEAMFAKPAGDEDLELFHEMRPLRMKANRYIDGDKKNV